MDPLLQMPLHAWPRMPSGSGISDIICHLSKLLFGDFIHILHSHQKIVALHLVALSLVKQDRKLWLCDQTHCQHFFDFFVRMVNDRGGTVWYPMCVVVVACGAMKCLRV